MNAKWTETRQLYPERETIHIHKPVPFLPVLTKFPQDSVVTQLFNNNNNITPENIDNETSGRTDISKTGNIINVKEPTEFKLPALVQAQSQSPPVSLTS